LRYLAGFPVVLPPEKLDISVLTISHEARDVDVVTGQVWRRIKQVQQILSPQNGSNDFWLRILDRSQTLRPRVSSLCCDCLQQPPSSVQLGFAGRRADRRRLPRSFEPCGT